MTPSLFKKRLRDHGFAYEHNPHGGCFTRVVSGTKQHVARDSVRGSAWRLYLAVGDVPIVWPAQDVKAREEPKCVEAESPWFTYFTDLDPADPLDAQCDSREVALDKCFDWLTAKGFEWLRDPYEKTADEWRTTHNILIRKRAGG
jgi:hypothetical protein